MSAVFSTAWFQVGALTVFPPSSPETRYPSASLQIPAIRSAAGRDRTGPALARRSTDWPSSHCGYCSSLVHSKLFIAVSVSFAILGILGTPGIEFVHRNSPTDQKYLIETMGGGVALLDYNNDGLLDVFLVNGGKLDAH